MGWPDTEVVSVELLDFSDFGGFSQLSLVDPRLVQHHPDHLVRTGKGQCTYSCTSLAGVPLQATLWCCDLDKYGGLETTYYPNQPS
jgi:hypothetical protein